MELLSVLYKARFQILASIISLSPYIHTGVCMAFATIVLPIELLDAKNTTNNTMPLNNDYDVSDDQSADTLVIERMDASWIASLIALTSAVGATVSGFFTERWGRKYTSLLTSVIYLISWCVLLFDATNVYFLYASRTLAGIAEGLCVSGIVYVTESTHVSVRSAMLAVCGVFISTGIVLVTLLGYFLTWRGVTYFSTASAVVMCISFYFIPESPVWIAAHTKDAKNEEKLRKSLQWLYRDPREYQEEFCRINNNMHIRPASQIDDCDPTAKSQKKIEKLWKPVLLLSVLFLLQQLSGCFVIIFYALQIFQAAGSIDMNAWTSLMVLGLIRLAMSICSSFQTFGRRTLLLGSSVGMTYSILFAALWLTFSSPSLVPVICCLSFVTFSSFGVLGLPFTLVGELLPDKHRGSFSGYLYGFVFIIMFITVQLFITVLDGIGLTNMFYCFTFFSAAITVFVFLCIPETLGRQLGDIQKDM